MATAKSPWSQYEGVSYWPNGCDYFYMLINYIMQILPFCISYTIWHTDHISRYPSWFLNGMSFFLARWRLQFHHTEAPMLAWTFPCLSLPAAAHYGSTASPTEVTCHPLPTQPIQLSTPLSSSLHLLFSVCVVSFKFIFRGSCLPIACCTSCHFVCFWSNVKT